jgi:hypothetical protein
MFPSKYLTTCRHYPKILKVYKAGLQSNNLYIGRNKKPQKWKEDRF